MNCRRWSRQGTNPICTDALMGFDPMAPGGTLPGRDGDSTLEIGEAAGIGTRDLNRIDVTGRRIDDVRFPFVPPA